MLRKREGEDFVLWAIEHELQYFLTPSYHELSVAWGSE